MSGLVPTIARDAPYSGLYLWLYKKLKFKFGNDDVVSARNFLCGLAAGVGACCLVQPADVLKTCSAVRNE